MMTDRNKIVDLLRNADEFNLISHMLPDGDSVGSLLALGEGLRSIGKKVNLFTPGHIPQKYTFLQGSTQVIHENNRMLPEIITIVLDSSDPERLSDFRETVMKSIILVNIDHHITNQLFGTLNLVDHSAAATGEIIFHILKDLEITITATIAEALYVAISTDTGSFKYDNTTAATHRVVASLLEHDFSPAAVSQKIFDERPLTFFMLLNKALSSLEIYQNRRIAVMTLSRDIRERSGASEDDLDGIVNYSRNIEGIEVGILFYVENKQEVKVGFRSKYLDVSKLASRLNGGGHIRAAGCRLQGSFVEIKKTVLRETISMLEENSV